MGKISPFIFLVVSRSFCVERPVKLPPFSICPTQHQKNLMEGMQDQLHSLTNKMEQFMKALDNLQRKVERARGEGKQERIV